MFYFSLLFVELDNDLDESWHVSSMFLSVVRLRISCEKIITPIRLGKSCNPIFNNQYHKMQNSIQKFISAQLELILLTYLPQVSFFKLSKFVPHHKCC